MSIQRTLEQQRAEKAWMIVTEEVDKLRDDAKKKYRGLAREVPILILTNGLGQTLAFLKSKAGSNSNDPHAIIYGHISQWLSQQLRWQSPGELLKQVITVDSNKYRQATTEALSFLNWIKRFAETTLPKEG